MRKSFLIIFFWAIVSTAYATTTVEYIEFKFSNSLVEYPQTHFFVICSDCKRNTFLEPYKKKVESIVTENKKKYIPPIISVAVREPEQSVDNNQISNKQQDITTVYFGFNSYVLSPTEKVKLDHFAKTGISEVTVTGHTCPIGTDHYNMVLGAKRAQAVADYLKQKGIKILKIISEGERQPIPNTSYEFLRRVEVQKLNNPKGEVKNNDK